MTTLCLQIAPPSRQWQRLLQCHWIVKCGPAAGVPFWLPEPSQAAWQAVSQVQPGTFFAAPRVRRILEDAEGVSEAFPVLMNPYNRRDAFIIGLDDHWEHTQTIRGSRYPMLELLDVLESTESRDKW